MAGKSYIKVGAYDWDRIKKIYIKTGGQTWSAVRKSYVKTSTGWRKVFDTASNRPFIAGNDIPKIRLNTFRTGSLYNPTGTLDDPVDPLVEAPPVQQMGPTWTSPTYGWPYESLGRHLWGYDGDWTSGNGSSMTFVYTWLYNLTGNSNNNTPEYNATSSTGRTDMLTNLSAYLGQNDGDYFDKNFLTFRVTATNSAGNASSESAPVYIVREVPTGSITMVSPASASTNSTMSATFTYSNSWYNKTDISNSYIEWFAVSNLGDALTNTNRVQIETLSSITVSGTTSKSGTTFHVPTIANKYYYVKMTLNNSGTQNAVIAITGFTPKSSVTSQSNKTVVTSAPLTAPSITSISSTIEGAPVTAYFSGGSGPYYQIYWTTGVAPGSGTTPDAEGSSSPLTDNTGPSTTGYTWYMYVRSVSSLGETSAGPSSLASSWSSGYAFTVASGILTAPTITSVTPGPQGGPVSVYFSGGTGPFYQAYWTGNTAPTTAVTPDASGSSSPLTDNTGPSSTGTIYMYVRSVKTVGETSVGPTTLASSWSAGVAFNMTSTAVTQNTAPTTTATSTFSTSTVKYLDSITWTTGSYNNAASINSVLLYSTNTSYLVSTLGDTSTSYRTSNPYSIVANDPTGTPYVFAVRDTVVGTNGTTYYFYSNQITSALADAVAFSYGTATSQSGGWTASINSGTQTGATYSLSSGTGTVNSSTGQVTVTGLGSNTTTSVIVTKSVSGYNNTNATASGTSASVNLTAPSISNVVKSGSSYLVYFSGGSGPAYQVWWQGSAGTPTTTSYDASGSSSPITVTNLTASAGATYYFSARSVSSAGNTGSGPSSTISSWSGQYAYTEPSATPATAPGIPGTPTNGWTSGTSYPFSWTAATPGTVSGGGAATISSYQIRIYEATSSSGTGSYLYTTYTSSGAGLSSTYTSPNAAKYYAASVSATNSAGLTSSSYSGISAYK